MNALFALALFVTPSQAGVVMPVESGVAPAGPSAPIVPVGAPAGGLIGAPTFGGIDLRGALPLLPSPVPGLVGPALNFVGNAPEAAAAKPETGAAQIAPAPAAARGRRADQTPALPAKASPGAPSLAISRERKAAASTPGNTQSLTRSAGEEARSNPLVDSSSLERARPETAAGLGRKFFDQSADENRGELADGAASPAESGQDESSVIARRAAGSSFGGGFAANGGGLAAFDAGAGFGAARGTSRTGITGASEGEILHDALASAPGAAAPGGAVAFYRSAAPNGDIAASAGAGGAVVIAAPNAPRPLSLDLSRSGLIVRVRSALNGVMGDPASSAVPAPKLALPGPSTALLERGAMLEAFSVAQAYAESSSFARSAAAGVQRSAPSAPLSPAADSSPAPLWWAWFALPLFVAAIRGIL